MGEVFLAEHVALNTQVVVKLLHAELSAKNTLVDRMRIEAQACARLNHPNIVRVTDFDRTPSGRPFFVMEYLPGQSLADVVAARGGWLPVAEAVEIVQQALDGLSAAHANGLVHRDIKLDNLFLCDQTTQAGKRLVKILDFGVAKVMSGAGDGAPAPLMVPTGTGVVVGTPRFFAPEQARGKALDHRADIYAVGLVLYSLVAGRGPFDEARNITEMAKAHVFTKPDPPSVYARQTIPDRLDGIVLRAIAKKPEQRFQSATEFSAMLGRVLEELAGQPQVAAPPAPDGLASTAYQPPAAPEVTGSEAPTHRLKPAHAGYPAHGYPPEPHAAPPQSYAQPSVPSPDLPPTGPLPDAQPAGHTQHAAAASGFGATAPGMTVVGPKRYSAGLAAAIVLIAGLLGAAVAAAAIRFL